MVIISTGGRSINLHRILSRIEDQIPDAEIDWLDDVYLELVTIASVDNLDQLILRRVQDSLFDSVAEIGTILINEQ